jgi:signal peptidase II
MAFLFKKSLTPWIWLGLIFLVLDRIFKWLVLKYPDFYSNQFLELKLFKNSKLYFIDLNPYLSYSLIGSVLLVFIILFLKTRNPGFLLIILGGLSNFFDRVIFGYVIDYFRLSILPISFFNIADLMIISGILLILFIHRLVSRIRV